MFESLTVDKVRLLFSRQALESHGIFVGFSCRHEGYSTGVYESLNLSFKVGDDPAAVIKNRLRLGGAVGIPPERWVLGAQVHGSRVAVVDEKSAGRGCADFLEPLEDTDGLITNTRNLLLIVLLADCLPLVLEDARKHVIAAVHCGWRGTLKGVVRVAVEKMIDMFSCEAEDISAYIGPHIRECCLELETDTAQLFGKQFGNDVMSRVGGERLFVSLEKAVSFELRTLGLRAKNIRSAGICTCCDTNFFSYRRQNGLAGRQSAMVCVL